jgi:quercetin dioxygenase-like cupin family protein
MARVLQLREHDLAAGAETALADALRVVYVERGEVRVGAEPVAEGAALCRRGSASLFSQHGALALVFELVDEPDPDAAFAAEVDIPGDRLVRCDRVDFPPGGVAYPHTHQGPGIRRLVLGTFRVDTGGRSLEILRGGAWFEAGPEPVYAEVVGNGPAAFVRVMLLPAALLGKPSIRYVREEDRDRPKSQRYTVLVDERITA